MHEGQPINCPYFKSEHWILDGKAKGVLRYRCKECGKMVTPLTGTSDHWIHNKDKRNKYLDLMLQSITLINEPRKLESVIKHHLIGNIKF